MKKHKLTLVIVLGLVLCLLCGMTTTFSWFSREYPKSADKVGEDGDTLKWSGQYKISNGQNISIKTVESNDDGTTFGENEVTDFGGSLQAGKRRYFCTEISNAGNTDQNVSLFLKNLKASDSASASGLYVGVNKPLKTYKSYSNIVGSSSTYVKPSLEKCRFYFDTNDVLSWKDSTTVIRMRYGTGDTSAPNWQDTVVMTQISGQSKRVLFADIPVTAKVVQFYANNDSTDANATPYMLLESYCPDLSVSNCYKFILRAATDGQYNNHNCDTKSFDKPLTDGANVINYYSIANIPLGSTFNAGLVAGTDYIGNSISYSSSSNSVFTVNSSGVITPVSTGTANLTTTITGGAYGDTYSVTTTINITSASTDLIDAPIVTNLEVGAAKADGATVSKVYWYIKNDSSSEVKYTLSGVYISL